MLEQSLLKQTSDSLASKQSVATHLVFSNLGQSNDKGDRACSQRWGQYTSMETFFEHLQQRIFELFPECVVKLFG